MLLIVSILAALSVTWVAVGALGEIDQIMHVS